MLVFVGPAVAEATLSAPAVMLAVTGNMTALVTVWTSVDVWVAVEEPSVTFATTEPEHVMVLDSLKEQVA